MHVCIGKKKKTQNHARTGDGLVGGRVPQFEASVVDARQGTIGGEEGGKEEEDGERDD